MSARPVEGEASPPAVDAAPYLARLRALADALERAASDTTPHAAAQLPVARLVELLEDLRTVELAALASKLTPIVDRLRAAMATPGLVAALREATAALRGLSGGGETPPPQRRRWAFWR